MLALRIYLIVANVMYTLLMLRHVSGDCAFRIWVCLRPEEITNIYHFCYNLQLNVMFCYIIVAFLICILQCTTRPKVQIQALCTKYKKLLVVVKDTSIFFLVNTKYRPN